jgi:uncharacterized protein
VSVADIPHGILGLALGLGVGFVLGLLGGGGSILALPIFLYVFDVPTKPAVPMSLAVVGASAFVGFLFHLRQGTVNLPVAVPFGVCAMVGAFIAARLAHYVPGPVQLSLFAVFAFTAAALMLRDSLRTTPPDLAAAEGPPHFSALLALQALAVGILTALIGAGGGFVIVPALVLLARVPIKPAVGSSLLIIAMNAASGLAGYVGQLEVDWHLVWYFTGFAAVGVIAGTLLVPRVPQRRIKQAFAAMILILGAYLVLRKLRVLT